MEGDAEPSEGSAATPDGLRFRAAIAAIDAANAQDPELLDLGRGEPRPKELVHAELVTDWVGRLDPTAGEAQLLAARAHHFRRWMMPRSEYPAGRAGYLRWRREAGRRHAAEVSELLVEQGYDDEVVSRVAQIIRKEDRAHDPQVQVHEDALCLVFLQTQLTAVVDRLGEDAVLGVLSRTLVKMSPAGIDAALSLELDGPAAELLREACRGPAQRGAAPSGNE